MLVISKTTVTSSAAQSLLFILIDTILQLRPKFLLIQYFKSGVYMHSSNRNIAVYMLIRIF